jgi:hypothetical protein
MPSKSAWIVFALGLLAVDCNCGQNGAVTPSSMDRESCGGLVTASGLSANVDYVQVGKLPADKFALDRAVLLVPRDLSGDATLAPLLARLDLQLLPNQGVSSEVRVRDQKKKPDGRLRPGNAPRALLVKVPTFQGSDSAEGFVRRRYPGQHVRVGTPRAWNVLAAILWTNEKAQAAGGDAAKLKLTPDFVVGPAQLFTQNKEGPNVRGMARNEYWQKMRLDVAWQLALAAVPPGGAPVTVAVVDQGFKKDPFGMVWDLDMGAPLDVPADDPASKWHGQNAGSVLGATVNDENGAFGSALLATPLHLPTSPPGVVQTMAVVMPAGEVTLEKISEAVEAAVFTAGVDIVTVSYSTWCGTWCKDSGVEAEFRGLLKDAAAHATVLFAAGNDSVGLDAASCPYLLGCSVPDSALCVGAVDRLGERTLFSNWGSKVTVWGPGDDVDVNPLEPSPNPIFFSGTSAASPFMAGVLALMEAAWGEKLAPAEWRALLQESSRQTRTHNAVPTIDAERVLRTKLKLKPEASEPNDSMATAHHIPNGPAKELLTLHSDTDVDYLAINNTACSTMTATVSSVRGAGFTVEVRDKNNQSLVPSQPLTPSGKLIAQAALKTADIFYLVVSNSGSTSPMPTAYSVDLTLTPLSPCPP